MLGISLHAAMFGFVKAVTLYVLPSLITPGSANVLSLFSAWPFQVFVIRLDAFLAFKCK